MSNYRRANTKGGSYFFTLVTYRRQRFLCDENVRNALRDGIRDVQTIHPFTIDGWVLLPDHLHCIWTLPNNDDDFSLRWRQIKSAFSRQLPTTERRSDSRVDKNERGIWQRRFWEHAIRNEPDYQRHVDYIHFNPVKHEWASRVSDWPYSTFSKYVEQGIYPLNWGNGYVEEGMDVGE